MSEARQEPLVIDVVSDVVCPWCFLGKRRLAAAIGELGEEALVRWRPYQLDPSIPPTGLDRKAYIERKFGKDDRIEAAHERLRALGREAGVAFDFERIARAPNTLDAHRLIKWAQAADAQDAVVDDLFSLYFEQGRDIGERDVLLQVAEQAGLDRERVAAAFAERRDSDTIRQEIAQAQQIGISGVPFFIFAGRLGVPGAQDPSVLLRAMAQARQAMKEPQAERVEK